MALRHVVLFDVGLPYRVARVMSRFIGNEKPRITPRMVKRVFVDARTVNCTNASIDAFYHAAMRLEYGSEFDNLGDDPFRCIGIERPFAPILI